MHLHLSRVFVIVDADVAFGQAVFIRAAFKIQHLVQLTGGHDAVVPPELKAVIQGSYFLFIPVRIRVNDTGDAVFPVNARLAFFHFDRSNARFPVFTVHAVHADPIDARQVLVQRNGYRLVSFGSIHFRDNVAIAFDCQGFP